MTELVCVHSYRTRLEAEYAQSLLAAHDIPAMVMVDDSGGADADIVQIVGGGARVLVRADHATEARDVLRASGDEEM